MISIYSSNNTDYSNNGNATLVPTSCIQKVEINGVWQVQMTHPYDNEGRWKYIVDGAVIKIYTTAVYYASAEDKYELYRIYEYKRGLHSVYCEAFPIAMDAVNNTEIKIETDNGMTGTQWASYLNQLFPNYTVSSDISSIAYGKYVNTNLISVLNGGNDSFVRLYNGEIKYANYKIAINKRIDKASGSAEPTPIDLRLGRDIKNISYEVDTTDVVTRIYPVGANGARLNYQHDYSIDENNREYVDSPKINDYPIVHKTFVETDYVICTQDSSSADNNAYVDTMDLLDDIEDATELDYRTILETFMADSFTFTYPIKGNITYVRDILKLKKEDDGVSGLQEDLGSKVGNGLKNNELKAMIKDITVKATDFVDDYDDSVYELAKITDRYTQLVSGIVINKGKDDDLIRIGRENSGDTLVLTKLCGYYHDDNGATKERKIWEGSETVAESPYTINVNLDTYRAHGLKLYYTLNNNETFANIIVGDLEYNIYEYQLQNQQFTNQPTKAISEWHKIDGRWHRFDSNGQMYRVSDKSEWIFFTQSGKKCFGNKERNLKLTSQWYKIDGNWYYFDDTGEAHDGMNKYWIADMCTLFNSNVVTHVRGITTIGEQTLYENFYHRLTDYATSMFSDGIDKPRYILDIDAMVLNNISGYEGFKNIQLGNRVNVHLRDEVFSDLVASNRVTSIEYDCISQRNKKITIGIAKDTVIGLLSQKTVNKELVAGYGIEIEGNVISAGGYGALPDIGGGSDVSVTVKQTTGHNIADIIVDDTTYQIYGGLKWWTETSHEIERTYRWQEGHAWDANAKFMYECDHHGKIWEYRMVSPEGMQSAIIGHPPIAIEPAERIPETVPERFAAGEAMIPNPDTSSDVKACYILWQLSDVQSMAVIHSQWHGDAPYITYTTPCNPSTTLYLYYAIQPAIDLANHDWTWLERYDYYHFPYADPNGDPDAPHTEENDLYIRQLNGIGAFASVQDFLDNIFEKIGLATYYQSSTGMASYGKAIDREIEDDDVIFWGGVVPLECENTEVTKHDYPYRVYNDGTLYCGDLYGKDINGTDFLVDGVSIDTCRDVKVNGTSVVDENKIANVTVPIYSAGTNIAIVNNVISATDTTYDVFEVGEDGLVPAPTSGDTGKYLRGDGTWAEVRANGTNALAWRNLTQAQYDALPSAEKNNGVMYLISSNAQGASGVTYIPITSANYEQLTPAEKNNDIPYFVSA